MNKFNEKDLVHYLPFITLVLLTTALLVAAEAFIPMVLTFIKFVVPSLVLFFIMKWTFWPDHGFSEQQIADGAELPELVWHQRLIKDWKSKK
jgi:hypothetical protein